MHNIMQMVRHAKIQVKKAHAAALFRFLTEFFSFFKESLFFMLYNQSKSLSNIVFSHRDRVLPLG